MKLSALAVAALLWQSSTLVNIGAVARPEHLRFQRSLILPGNSGYACAPLDATVLAHTASAGHQDLRLYQRLPGSSDSEVPFVLTESGPEPVADTEVSPDHPLRHGNTLSFDLRMPPRPYSELRLRLNLHDFIGSVTVTGANPHTHNADLGSFSVFDLTSRHLGRWTALPMQETAWPLLHLTLTLRTPDGAPLNDLSPAVLDGVTVPPSRERQTVYVPTVSTRSLSQRGSVTIALLRVPAHVPVERVSFDLDPAFNANFSREVIVTARPDGGPPTDTEAIDAGAITLLNMPSGDPRLNPIDLRQTTVDATLGATLATGATVRVAIHNLNDPPLPIRSVTLEMRRRQLCFFADREAAYTLRYGDPTLTAPIYDDTALHIPANPLDARLGPETKNPHYRPRLDTRSYLKRHPELFWLLLLTSAGIMGGMALHHVQHRRV